MKNGCLIYQIVVLALIFTCSGCSLLQNVRKTNDKKEVSSENDQTISNGFSGSSSTVKKSVQFEVDTTKLTHKIQIWPKGQFIFSSDKGFVGAAEKVEVETYVKYDRHKLVMDNSVKKENNDSMFSLETHNSVNLKESKSSIDKSVSWKIMIFAAVLISLLSFFAYSKIRRMS
jgi:hypothetical protein